MAHKIRCQLFVDIETDLDNETSSDVVRYLVGEDLANLGYVIHKIDATQLVNPKIADLKQEILSHLKSENMVLDTAKELIDAEEYKYRKAELKRQKFYMTLIFSKF